MKFLRMKCESTKEGKEYLEYNSYTKPMRIGTNFWVVSKLGMWLRDVEVLNK